ncbi:hypothetical protein DFH11DRAFT_1840857 [Phellopilus nigrolimitatus]|nr:hypothetical protein DFH11DRAFT_1840857 [Phellopilus nigrolimitatus]
MNKSQFYLSECAQSAERSPMCFKLGAVMVKGGKVISSGYNHHRPHYDGLDVRKHGHRKPVSMHAEMHAIFTLTGMSPSFKKQVQGIERRIPKGCTAPERRLSGAWTYQAHGEVEGGEEVGRGRGKQGSSSSTSENSSSGGEASGSESSGRDTPARASSPTPEGFVNVQMEIGGKGARWDQRRRDPRANGADIYVARITKSGCGNARPCWRCLEWCKWAGIKRIFHWN